MKCRRCDNARAVATFLWVPLCAACGYAIGLWRPAGQLEFEFDRGEHGRRARGTRTKRCDAERRQAQRTKAQAAKAA